MSGRTQLDEWIRLQLLWWLRRLEREAPSAELDRVRADMRMTVSGALHQQVLAEEKKRGR